MADQALILHLANTLAALADARATAPSASPTWRGLDAVEAATRQVVTAAHAVVAGATATGSLAGPINLIQMPSNDYRQYLRLGTYTINKENITYFEELPFAIAVHCGESEAVLFSGEEAETLRAWLDMEAERMVFTLAEHDKGEGER